MKKISLLLALILALSLGFIACVDSDDKNTTTTTQLPSGGEDGGEDQDNLGFTFRDIPNATKLSANDNEWSINDYLGDTNPAKYFIIASVGGGNENGFSGIQPQFQGEGFTDAAQIKTTGNWTDLAHAEDEIVYFIFDLSLWDNYEDLCKASWAQFRINYGADLLGEFQCYIVDGSVTSLTKPGNAVDFELKGEEDKEAAPGYATLELPVELTEEVIVS